MDEDMEQLVDSIKRNGVMTPATVRQKEDGRYELIKIRGNDVQDKCSFESFLDDEFNQYLSSAGESVYSTSQHEKINEKFDALNKKYPKVKDVIDMESPHELSEECTALIRVGSLKNELVALEMQEFYFKGCGNCVGYLIRMKLL